MPRHACACVLAPALRARATAAPHAHAALHWSTHLSRRARARGQVATVSDAAAVEGSIHSARARMSKE